MTPRRPEIAAFQPDAQAIEERPLPPAARASVYAVAALLVSAVAWAALFEVDRVVVAEGRLVPTTPLILLQPLETGMVRSLDVAVGQIVRAGDRLVTLDPTFTQADLEVLRERYAGLSVEVNRLTDEMAGRLYRPSEDSLANANTSAVATQVALAAQRAAELTYRLSTFDAQEAQVGASRAAAVDAQAVLAERLAVAGQVQAIRDELERRSVGSRLQVLDAQLNRLSLEGQLAAKKAEILDLDHRLKTLGFERETLRREWLRQTQERLIASTRERDAVAQDLVKAERRNDLVELRAPRDGVVLEVAQRAVGSLARAAEPLITLVPAPAVVEAEVAIDPQDIARVRAGDPVRVKMDALPFQRHGLLDGHLRAISEDALPVGDGAGSAAGASAGGGSAGGGRASRTVFRARVALAEPTFRDPPPGFRLIPGMTVRAEILIGRRSVLSYLLYPLLRGLDESLREP